MTVVIIDPSHPFYPHLRAKQLADTRPPGHYPLPFEEWLTWHYHCRLRGAGFVASPTADTALAL